MSQRTGIEWTDTTWNPVTGCTQVSEGCDNCYALTLSRRLLSTHYTRRRPAKDTPANRRDPFSVRLWAERVNQPATWREPRRVFVNSMGDLFHVDVPEPFVRKIFETMLAEDRHIYQVLTKRPARLMRFARRNPDLLVDGAVAAHIWVGTSIENAKTLFRADQLRDVPARVRFLSCEPLLGPVELNLEGLHWVIAGGESGHHYRPLDLDWVRAIRDECQRATVPFFFKQVGGKTPKAGGRTLDARTWSEYPAIR